MLKTKISGLFYTFIAASFTFAHMPPHGFNKFKSNYFVETGPHSGHSIEQALSAGFETIHAVELNSKIAHWTAQRFKNHNNVHIWQGDSGTILYDVIRTINEPITFWLNAYNYSNDFNIENTPILRELEQIKRHHIKTHTLLIDSIKCAGTRQFDYISLESIVTKIKEINPNYRISYIAGGDNAESNNNILVAQASEYISPYLDPNITNKINKKEVNIILEVGAFDGQDSVQLYKYYQCPIISFECAPESIKKCRDTLQYYPCIKLVEKAAWNETSRINFYYCPTHPGSSSCFFFDYQRMASRDHQSMHQLVKRYPIKSIKVDATRLDEWLNDNQLDHIDMLCMTPQGSALPVLEGLGSYLAKVKYIVTQIMYQPIHKDEALFPQINDFMQKNGFTLFNAEPNGFFNWVIFIRKDLC